MKKCPICRIELEIITYEIFKIMHCPQCNGHLLPLARLDPIKQINQLSSQQLKNDVERNLKKDSTEKIKCPKCMMFMKKEKIKIPVLNVSIDICRTCKLVWLDAGELALLQIAYEASRNFANMRALKNRMEALELSPERKKSLDDAIARLPDTTNPFETGIKASILDVAGGYIERLLLSLLIRKI